MTKIVLEYIGEASFVFAISVNGKTLRFDPLRQDFIELDEADAMDLLERLPGEWALPRRAKEVDEW
jgi:hypothetical protein